MKQTVTEKSLLELLAKQHYRCALTGRTLTPDDCDLDHIDPYSETGLHSIENCQLVVRHANAAKGTMTQDEFIQLCIDVVQTWKARQQDAPHADGS